MLARAADRWPHRTAVIDQDGRVTFAGLEDAVGRLAHRLRARLGGSGAVVGVSAQLSIDYVVAYYAVLRSGNVIAPLNPLLPGPMLAHNLSRVEAALVLATPEVAERLAQVRGQLPAGMLVTGLSEARGPGRPGAEPAILPERAPADPACVLFTSGTTGMPKAVVLSHHNITVNALQVAQAHRLGPETVSLVNLPTYHPMHLNPAILSGAVQVLCPVPDVGTAIGLAREHRATHYYSMPVWLMRLATHTGLVETRLPELRVIASGGSALPADAADLLTKHFEVPVLQGYGLAETSPLTHSDEPVLPLRGSVGFPVARTECMVTDLDSGAPQPPGRSGEVRVRGPQVMLGYVGEEPGSHLDADGWFATGDVGRMEPDGRLVLIDRIKDVFKRDNLLVSPGAIEKRLRAHPAVAECVVVDYPDKFAGAVAAAFVVPEPGFEDRQIDEIVAFANTEAPRYEHLEFVEVVEEIPRSAGGKVQRPYLRAEMLRRRRRGQ
nr:class I adenylate-forming enzyme family protein [Streptomyces sp. SID11385]